MLAFIVIAFFMDSVIVGVEFGLLELWHLAWFAAASLLLAALLLPLASPKKDEGEKASDSYNCQGDSYANSNFPTV